jgi:hypothetical protein
MRAVFDKQDIDSIAGYHLYSSDILLDGYAWRPFRT